MRISIILWYLLQKTVEMYSCLNITKYQYVTKIRWHEESTYVNYNAENILINETVSWFLHLLVCTVVIFVICFDSSCIPIFFLSLNIPNLDVGELKSWTRCFLENSLIKILYSKFCFNKCPSESLYKVKKVFLWLILTIPSLRWLFYKQGVLCISISWNGTYLYVLNNVYLNSWISLKLIFISKA